MYTYYFIGLIIEAYHNLPLYNNLITDHEGPEGDYQYNFTLSLTPALDGVGGKRHTRPLYPWERQPVPRRLGG
jgi:hypothetical protein